MLKKSTKVISVILSIVMLAGVLACAAFAATSEEADTHLQFNEDGEFKILQIADMQDSWPMKLITKNLIKAAVETEQPDLIVLSGDNINTGAGKSAITAPMAINEFMSIFEEYGIPVAAVFGNHDAEGDISRFEQIGMYEKYDCFIGCSGVDFGNYTSGTYYIPLYSSADANDMAFNIWMIDSGDYNRENDLDGYAAVTKAQIEWYVETSKAIEEANGEKIPSVMFQHIVVPEVYNYLALADENTEGAVKKYSDTYYVLPEGTKGVMAEAPGSPMYSNGQFDAVVERGDVIAMFFGHDHVNTYELDCGDIWLCNSPGIGFSSYNSEVVGVRTVTINEDDPWNFETEVCSYFDYFDYEDDAARYLYELNSDTTDTLTKFKAFFLYVFAIIEDYIGVAE